MRSTIYSKFGGPEVLHPAEVPTPVPGDNDILVRVRATPVSSGDLMARRFDQITPREFGMPLLMWLPARLYFGLRKPRIQVLGSEFAGEVAAVGSAVTRFKVGDPLMAYRGQAMGAYAELVCMPEDGIVVRKPEPLSYEQAACVPYGGMMALNMLQKVALRPSQRILINGASGGIGSGAVQLAKHHFGAHVTGVCGTPRLDYVRALGADVAIDYTREDFTRNGERYDVIFDVLGKSSFATCRSSLTDRGIYLLANFKLPQLLRGLWTSVVGGQRVVCALAPEGREDLETIRELAEGGKFTAVVDRTFALDEAAAAHAYVESGRARGKVVLTVG